LLVANYRAKIRDLFGLSGFRVDDKEVFLSHDKIPFLSGRLPIQYI